MKDLKNKLIKYFIAFLICGIVAFFMYQNSKKDNANINTNTNNNSVESNIPNETKGKRMPNIPYLLANAGLEFHRENLFGGKGQNTRFFADMAFVEEYLYDFELTNNVKRRIPRTTTFDLGFEHSFMNQRLFISGKIANLTDEKVISEFNRPLPGRSLGIKLRYIFR